MGCGITKLDNNILNEIKNNLDIVDVISNYLTLTLKGKNYFGVCPFHDDHSPSMSVSKEKQIYTCFSCGATGNVFKFIQDYENLSFLEAVKKCADMANISVEIGKVKKNDKYQTLYDIYNISHKFYINNINTENGKKALEYLHSRNLSDEIIKEFEIGLSLNDNTMLTKLLKVKKFSDSDLIKSGLVNENNFELNDVYRNRIMFPLFDLQGKVIGYNGRVYNGEKENKYINSKETEIFKKRELLYNYYRAKDYCRQKKSVIIMEGPMDVIRAYSIGVKNCVATLGTAFGNEQAMLVRKLSSNVILCFDGDDAGLKATKTTIEELSKLGIVPKIVRLENNSDPDEYILNNGKEAFLDKINNPMNILEFKDKLLKKSFDLSKKEDLTNYVKKMIEEINIIDDEILKEVSINKLSEETNIDKDIIKKNIKKKKIVNFPVERKIIGNKFIKSEKYLLYYMLLSEDAIKLYEERSVHIPTSKYRQLAFQIDSFYNENGYIDISDLITSLKDDDESIRTIGEITSLSISNNINLEEIKDFINNIREYNEKEQINDYKLKLKEEDSYNKKLEIAMKAIEIKKRREENDRRN